MSAQELEVITLPSHFSQAQLCGLKELVDHKLEDGHQLQFDAADIEKVDGAAVQFLLASAQVIENTGRAQPLVVNANQVLTNAFDDMGVLDLIKFHAQDETAKSED